MSLKKDIIEAEFRTKGANKIQQEIGNLEGNIKRLNRENERLRINKTKLEAQGKKNTKAWQALNDQIKRNSLTVKEQKLELSKLNSQLKITEMSANQLRKKQRELRMEMNGTTRAADPDRWKKLNKEYGDVSKQLKKVSSGGQATNRMLNAMKAALPIAGVGALLAMLGRLTAGLLMTAQVIQGDAVRSSVVFGDQLEYVQEQAKGLAKQMGFTNREFVAAAAATADLLIPLNFTREQAATMSVELQSLAGALDEWTGGQLGSAEVSKILTKAMLGENEQLKQLGIAIRKDTDEFRDLVKQKIADTGATKVQAEAMATLELIQRKSIDAQTAYTQEGNKLLRFFKRIKVELKQMKEGFIALFDENQINKIKDERIEMNNLADFILKTKEGTDERRLAIEQFNTKYGKYLENLLTEKSTLEDIRDAQREANAELVTNIAMLEQKDIRSEYLEKEKAPVRAILDKVEKNRPGTSDVVATQIQSILEGYKKLLPELKENEVYSEETKSIITNYLVETGRKYGIASADLRAQLNTLVNLDKEMEAKIQESAKVTASILGGDPSDFNFYGKTSGDDAPPPPPKDPTLDDLLKNLDQYHQERMMKIKANYANEQIEKNTFDAESFVEEQLYLESKKLLLEQFGQDTAEVREELMDLEIESNERIQAWRDAQYEEDKENRDKSTDEIIERLEQEFSAEEAQMQKEIALDQRKFQKKLQIEQKAAKKSEEIRRQEQKNFDRHFNMMSNFSSEMGGLFGQMLDDTADSTVDYNNRMKLVVLDYITKVVRMYVVEIWAKQLAEKGPLGLITAGGLTLVVEALLAKAKSGLTKKINKNESDGYAEGGHTGFGSKYEPAGIVHRNEYVIPEEGYLNPKLRPFINMIESSRKSGSLRYINPLALPQRGYSDGGPVASPGTPSYSGTDPDLILFLELNYLVLKKLSSEGVISYIGDPQVKDIRDRINIIEGIEKSVSR